MYHLNPIIDNNGNLVDKRHRFDVPNGRNQWCEPSCEDMPKYGGGCMGICRIASLFDFRFISVMDLIIPETSNVFRCTGRYCSPSRQVRREELARKNIGQYFRIWDTTGLLQIDRTFLARGSGLVEGGVLMRAERVEESALGQHAIFLKMEQHETIKGVSNSPKAMWAAELPRSVRIFQGTHQARNQ